MAKRNQYNRSTFNAVNEMTMNKVLVESGVPEFTIRMSNPGAATRHFIIEETIDFATARANNTHFYSPGLAGTHGVDRFSGSVAIPAFCRIDAVGIYIGENAGIGSSSGDVFKLHKVGLTGSRNQFGVSIADRDTYFGSVAMSQSTQNIVLFPRAGQTTGSLNDSGLFMGATGSVAQSGSVFSYSSSLGSLNPSTRPCISFEVTRSAQGRVITGSITYAMYLTEFAAPTGSGTHGVRGA